MLFLTSLVAQTVKRLSAMQETWVRSLGWEDPLEKEMAIHSRTVAWKIPWTEEPGRLQSMSCQSSGGGRGRRNKFGVKGQKVREKNKHQLVNGLRVE